jgi:hypothetical protein
MDHCGPTSQATPCLRAPPDSPSSPESPTDNRAVACCSFQKQFVSKLSALFFRMLHLQTLYGCGKQEKGTQNLSPGLGAAQAYAREVAQVATTGDGDLGEGLRIRNTDQEKEEKVRTNSDRSEFAQPLYAPTLPERLFSSAFSAAVRPGAVRACRRT